jgi:hypothetical protein
MFREVLINGVLAFIKKASEFDYNIVIEFVLEFIKRALAFDYKRVVEQLPKFNEFQKHVILITFIVYGAYTNKIYNIINKTKMDKKKYRKRHLIFLYYVLAGLFPEIGIPLLLIGESIKYFLVKENFVQPMIYEE